MIQFYMIKKLRTELMYFFAILVVLALALHPDLLSTPLARLEHMQNRGNFLHPFAWSFGLYIIVLLIRLLIKGISYLKNKVKEKN